MSTLVELKCAARLTMLFNGKTSRNAAVGNIYISGFEAETLRSYQLLLWPLTPRGCGGKAMHHLLHHLSLVHDAHSLQDNLWVGWRGVK